MSLLTTVNQGSPALDYFIHNDGTAVAPVIRGTAVQLGQPTGPIASAFDGDSYLTSSSGTNALHLGTLLGPNMINCGPTAEVSVQVDLNIVDGADVVVQDGGNVSIAAPGFIDLDGDAPHGTFRADVVVGNAANSATTPIANPVGLVEGVYAIMLGAVAGDSQAAFMASATGYWDGLTWAAGGCGSTNNAGGFCEIAPNAARTSLGILNFLGSAIALTNITVKFVQLAGS